MSLLKAMLDNMPYLPAAATGGKYLSNVTRNMMCGDGYGRFVPNQPSMQPSTHFHICPSCLVSGSVFWYFVLLNYVKEEDLAFCSTSCASLLTTISRQLQDRLTPLEALLQTRYLTPPPTAG